MDPIRITFAGSCTVSSPLELVSPSELSAAKPFSNSPRSGVVSLMVA